MRQRRQLRANIGEPCWIDFANHDARTFGAFGNDVTPRIHQQ
jgi:hypothetical protein